MLDETGFRRRRFAAIIITSLALFATACSGGVRPTVTADRLEDAAISVSAGPTPIDLDDPSAPVPDRADATAQPTESESDTGEATAVPEGVEQLVVEVIEAFPHDQNAFTQGLELHDGLFIESTGLYGESTLRRVVPFTGEVTQSTPIANQFFAEGLTQVDDQIIQLTWRENTAFFWDAESFELNREVSYQGEGWGLCHDGSRLIMTDGTPVLIFRDPLTFDETGRVSVTLDGQDVFNLNEVECVNGMVWANIWQTDIIVRIDPATGLVTGVVDATVLEGPDGPVGAVLNGIAWDSSTQSFYVTGKLWPTMYRVNFVPAPAS